jgi:sodium transport system permease protein
LAAWLKHWAGRRTEYPSTTYAILCAVLILVAKFFSTFMAVAPTNWSEFAWQTVGLLFVAVTLPAIIFALATCRRPWKCLQLKLPQPWTIVFAALLAVFMHPIFAGVTELVLRIYPINASAIGAETAVRDIMNGAPGIFTTLLVLAIAPAICEEIAFRGFVLSGLRSNLGKLPAILLTSLFFGLAHSVLQQSIITFFVGILLGILVVRTGSIFPCIAFHAVHNSLTILFVQLDPEVINRSEWLQNIIAIRDGVVVGYQPMAAIVCGFVAILLLLILWRHRLEETLWQWRSLRAGKSASAIV